MCVYRNRFVSFDKVPVPQCDEFYFARVRAHHNMNEAGKKTHIGLDIDNVHFQMPFLETIPSSSFFMRATLARYCVVFFLHLPGLESWGDKWAVPSP